MTSWARPGAKCVCVDADSGYGGWWDDAPINGQIYTVRDIWIDQDGDTIVDFVELQRSLEAQKYLGRKLGFWIERFRPLVTRTIQSDLAIFTPLLDTVEEDA